MDTANPFPRAIAKRNMDTFPCAIAKRNMDVKEKLYDILKNSDKAIPTLELAKRVGFVMKNDVNRDLYALEKEGKIEKETKIPPWRAKNNITQINLEPLVLKMPVRDIPPNTLYSIHPMEHSTLFDNIKNCIYFYIQILKINKL